MKWRAAVSMLLLLAVRVESSPSPTPDADPPAVTGTILSSSGDRPLKGARVEAFEDLDQESLREARAARDLLESPLATGFTDSAGHFRLRVPEGSSFIVVAEAPGHVRSRYERSFRSAPGGAPTPAGRIRLGEGRRLTGRIVGPDGGPVGKATIIALTERAAAGSVAPGMFPGRSDGPAAPYHPSRATSLPDGSFTLESVPLAPVTLRVFAAGLAPGVVRSVRTGDGLIVKLGPGHTLKGRAVGPDGKSPAASAWVMAGEDGWDGMTRTEEDGSFRLDLLPAGSTSLVATMAAVASPGGRTGASDTWAASAIRKLKLPRPEEAPPTVLRLRPGGIIEARVVDEETRRPIEGARVVLSAPGESEPRQVVSGESGRVSFTGVPVGKASLRAGAEGFLDESYGALALAPGQTRQVTAALRASAAIEGTVRDATGQPVGGATISVSGLLKAPVRLPRPIFTSLDLEPVTSDAQGRFRLTDLPPREEIRIEASSAGFVPWTLEGIKLRPGESRTGLEILLDAGSFISGRILDGEGQPVVGASVTASRREEGSGQGIVVISRDSRGGGAISGNGIEPVLSSEGGRFRVAGTRDGIWSLEIEAPGFAPRKVAGLKLEAGEPLDAGEIRLEPGAIFSGTVTDKQGQPVGYARGAVTKEFHTLSEFTAGPDGGFATEDLSPDDLVTLTVDAPGYASVELAGLRPPQEQMAITLVPSSRVSGRVLDAETRQPVPDFEITVSRTRSGGGGGMRMNILMAGSAVAFHDEDGAFVLEDVDPGDISLTVDSPGYRSSQMADVEVPQGEDLEGIVMVLDRAAAVSGTVVDDRGRPVPNVTVQKKQKSGGMGMMIGVGRGAQATTDGDGNFRLDGLEDGPVTLAFSHPDFEPAELDVDTGGPSDSLMVTLSRGASLVGVVLHEEEGTPIAGATVSAVAAGGNRFQTAGSATTGPDGAFVIEALSSGRYSVQADAPGLRSTSLEDIVVAPGTAPPPLELRMGGGVTILGSITGLDEARFPDFTVRAVRSGGGFGASAPVDTQGRFEIRGLSAGAFTLVASSGFFGGRSQSTTIDIPEGTTSFETTIDFPRGHSVEGLVTRAGQPVAGASVIFMRGGTRTSLTTKTDASGHYLAENLEPGEYDVAVLELSMSVSHDLATTVSGDEQLDIEIPVAILRGFVTDLSTGKPLQNAAISVEPAAGTGRTGGLRFERGASTDATGYFQIENLDAGGYTVTAQAPGYGFDSRGVTIVPSVDPGEIAFELRRVDALSFRVIDATSGLPLRTLSTLVLSGGGDPLAGTGGLRVVFRGGLSADASGVFRLDTLQPGSYRLVLGGQGIATTTIHDLEVPGPELKLTAGPGGSLEVRAGSLQAGETARAVLLDEEGLPIHLNTYREDPSFELRPDEPAVLGDVPPGSYRLRVALPGGASADKPVQVATGSVQRVVFP